MWAVSLVDDVIWGKLGKGKQGGSGSESRTSRWSH